MIMKKLLLSVFSASTLLTLPTLVQAEKNIEMYQRGEQTHDSHCNKCHTSSVYTRETRFIKSLEALSKQVKRCKTNTGAAWFNEDTEAVVHFLNEKYYKF